MLDIKLIRENPDVVRDALNKRGDDTKSLEEILSIDKQRREILIKLENLRADHRKASKQLGSKSQEERQTAIAELAARSEEINKLEEQITKWESSLNELLLRLPNIPDKSVPIGKGSEDNKVLSTWGDIPKFPFKPLPHWEIGEKLGIIDFERGVKLSGTRFYVLRGLGSRMQRALINFMLDLHVNEHGYTEIYPPFMVKGQCLYGAGQLPKFGDNLYHDAEEDLWWVPTAEVPLTNLHRDEILPPGSLPIYYVAYTPCFRREKMAAGKDTRGIKRGHQFDKVEMYKFVEPDKSFDELEKLLHDAEDVVKKLKLPYRILPLCTGDLGFASAKTYDIEVWAAGSEEWLEVSSCSNCVDFQARRANIRFRPEPTAKPRFPHTLNGSGLALPRIVISILENYQQADGSVVVPEVLRKYMGVDVIR